MKVVILAGGYGTRLSEETIRKPKPMVEVGGKPILWHIMRHYSYFGFNNFVIALGYKGGVIKEYFQNHDDPNRENWDVQLIDTGDDVMTGGRIGRLKDTLDNSPFLLTYGDGVSNVDIKALVEYHKQANSDVTLTAVHPPSRFGAIEFDGDKVIRFAEKPQTGEGWINGGFMVMEPAMLNHMKSDDTVLEKDVLEVVAADGKLAAYKHQGFWTGMDTRRDVQYLESLWETGKPPWQMTNE